MSHVVTLTSLVWSPGRSSKSSGAHEPFASPSRCEVLTLLILKLSFHTSSCIQIKRLRATTILYPNREIIVTNFAGEIPDMPKYLRLLLVSVSLLRTQAYSLFGAGLAIAV